MNCRQEMCPNWSGDGNVCPCAVFGLEPGEEFPDLRGTHFGRELRPIDDLLENE